MLHTQGNSAGIQRHARRTWDLRVCAGRAASAVRTGLEAGLSLPPVSFRKRILSLRTHRGCLRASLILEPIASISYGGQCARARFRQGARENRQPLSAAEPCSSTTGGTNKMAGSQSVSSSRKCCSSFASSAGGDSEDIRITSGRRDDSAARASSSAWTTITSITSASTLARINASNRRPRSGSGSRAMMRKATGSNRHQNEATTTPTDPLYTG